MYITESFICFSSNLLGLEQKVSLMELTNSNGFVFVGEDINLRHCKNREEKGLGDLQFLIRNPNQRIEL